MAIYTVTVNTDGSGAGSASTPQPVRGYLKGVKVTFGGTPAATTDTTITEEAGLGRTLLTLTNVNANGYYNPSDQIHNTSGAAQAFYLPFYIPWSKLTVTVAQGVTNTAGAVVVQFIVDED